MQNNVAIAAKTERFKEEALVHMDSIHKYAMYISKNNNDAKDLVQETYIKAYKFFDKFTPGTNCKAWLIKILRNTFVNNIRREKKHLNVIYTSEINEQWVELSGHTDPEDTIFGNLFDDDMVAAMNSLPIEYRITVSLADIDGLSYKDIAEITDCPLGTVMSRLCRGHRILKKKLQDYAVQHGYI